MHFRKLCKKAKIAKLDTHENSFSPSRALKMPAEHWENALLHSNIAKLRCSKKHSLQYEYLKMA